MHKWYKEPEILPSIGLSDHQSILLTPACQPKQPKNINKKSIRKITSSSMKSLGNFITSLDWTRRLYRLSSCQDKYDLFYNLLMLGLNTFLPKKKIKIHCRDKPWITPELKRLISGRQKALAAGDRDPFKRLRNIINRAIKDVISDVISVVTILTRVDGRCRRGQLKSGICFTWIQGRVM